MHGLSGVATCGDGCANPMADSIPMPERPFQFGLSAAVGALSLSAVAFGMAKLDSERVLWGVFSVIGLAGLGIAIALVGVR